MVLDGALIPQSSHPVFSKISILTQSIAATVSIMILCFILYTTNKGVRCSYIRQNSFENAAIFSVSLTVVLGMFDFFCWTNFLVAWDYLDTDSGFITNVDGITVIGWCVCKCAFYFVFHQHLRHCFAAHYPSVRSRLWMVRIVFITAALVVLLAGAVVVYADAKRKNETELLRINPYLVMVNPCASLEWYNLAAHAIAAASDLAYFITLALVYQQIYAKKKFDRSHIDIGIHNNMHADNNNNNNDSIDMSVRAMSASVEAVEKAHAKRSTIAMIVSTSITVLADVLIIFQVVGRWTVLWTALTCDDLCVLYLILGARSMIAATADQNQKHNVKAKTRNDVEHRLIGGSSSGGMSSSSAPSADESSDSGTNNLIYSCIEDRSSQL